MNLGKGRLHDVSVAVKDIFCTDDMPTSCASEMLRGVHPADCPEHIHTLKW